MSTVTERRPAGRPEGRSAVPRHVGPRRVAPRVPRRIRLAALPLAFLIVAGGPTPATAAPAPAPTAVTPVQLQVYGAWHCSNDACTWGSVRSVEEFDSQNHWLVDRSDGTGRPSVNLVVLSFVNPLRLLNGTTDGTTVNGVPRGMTPEIVRYFTSREIRVMVSIGGITYVKDWNTALATDAAGLGRKAAALATALGVGVEIDYEEAKTPDLVGLESFVRAYRAIHPYDSTGTDPTARLTIDLAAGDRWLIGITRKATADWLRTSGQEAAVALDYANAMVPSRQPTSAADAQANWQEHISGKPQYAPPILPLAPSKLAVSLYVAGGTKVLPECNSFATSLQSSTGTWLRTVSPSSGYGTSAGALGYMFWAAERQGSGKTTAPPNTCEKGVGAGAATYAIPVPMPALRAQ